MPAVIRPATPADAATLAELAAITFPLACPPDATDEAKADFIARNLGADSFARYVADPLRALFVAEEPAGPDARAGAVGYAMLVHGAPTDPEVVASITVQPTSELSKLYVHPDHHGAGTAAALVAACVAAARAAGSAAVWLGVNDQNARANRFYEKQGFRAVGRKHFQLGERLEEDFVRELVLASPVA